MIKLMRLKDGRIGFWSGSTRFGLLEQSSPRALLIILQILFCCGCYLEDVGKAAEEGHQADDEDQQLVALEVAPDGRSERVFERRDHHFDGGKLRVDAKTQQHREKHQRPQVRPRHLRQRLEKNTTPPVSISIG